MAYPLMDNARLTKNAHPMPGQHLDNRSTRTLGAPGSGVLRSNGRADCHPDGMIRPESRHPEARNTVDQDEGSAQDQDAEEGSCHLMIRTRRYSAILLISTKEVAALG